MINHLELENWKAHGHTSLHFSKGTNILIGQMGAGKSSILAAISFALFGTFPAIKNRRVKVEDVVRNKPIQMRTARLKLDFDADGINYTVERTVSLDDSAKATLKRDGAYVQSQPQRVTEEIEKVLKVDYDLFSRAVYSEQNRIDYFLELGSSERKKQIDNLLGLDRFAAAQENSTSLINRIKDMVEDAEKTAKSFDINKMENQLKQLSADIKRISEENNDAEAKLKLLTASRETTEASLNSLKELLNKKIRLDKEAAELRSRIAVLEKEIATADSAKLRDVSELAIFVSASELSIAKLQKEVSENSDIMQSIQARLGKHQKELSDIEKAMKEKAELTERSKSKNLDSLKSALEAESKVLETSDGEYAKSTALKNDAEKSLAELRKHFAKCPVCDSDLTEEKRLSLIEAKSAVVRAAESRITELSKTRVAKKDRIVLLNKELNSLAVMLEKLKAYGDLTALYSESTVATARLSEELAKAKESFRQTTEKLSLENKNLSLLKLSMETAERIGKHIADKKKYALLLDLKIKEMSEINADNSAVDILQKHHTQLSSDIAEKNAKLGANKKMLEDKKKQMSEKEEEKARIDSIYKELTLKKSSIDDLSKFRNSLAETQALLRKRLVSSVNEIMHSIWPEIYPYGDYTGILLSASDSDYELQLKSIKNNEYTWESVNSIASGGERSIACMAMRIAFSLVLVPNLRWLILDEPTHNIDQQGLSKFVRLLNEGLPGIVEQIFIITHDEQLKQVSNGRIYSLSRNKAENREAVLEEL